MPDFPVSPGLRPGLAAALADRYTIERELGRGGNATVYLAHDVKHDRPVALKVLQPELAAAVRAERFLREIQIAARLSHPGILSLFDSGEIDGVLFYAMPYVAGESLRGRLNREKQLPLDHVLAIVLDVSSALDHAHSHGVVHRDIKPENILISDGKPILMDFGIARALTSQGSTVTETGIAIGTPAYMSPEQSAAGATVDGRSDVYSLGCVVYEMLAGHPPFAGASAQELLARHSLDPVPSLRAARPDVSAALERVLAKALAKVPAARFGSAGEFAKALVASAADARRFGRRASYIVSALVAGAVLAGVLVPRLVSREDKSVAVMPFANLTNDSSDRYFGEGISEDIVNALSRVEGLRVVPVHAAYLTTTGGGKSIQRLGGDLNVARILEGSFSRVGDQLKITARLVNVRDNGQEWGDSYSRKLQDIFAVQAEVSGAIVQALQLKLASAGTATPFRPQTGNLQAYDLYLRGRYYWNRRSRENAKKAIEYFAAAIAQDSTYALAYSGLADSYIWAGIDQTVPRSDAFPKAKAAALRAVALDPNSAEAHTSLGRVRYNVDWDWVGTEDELKRAISLNPKYPFAHSWYGYYLANVKVRYGEAIREAAMGFQLDSLAPMIAYNLIVIYQQSGRDAEAEPILRKAIELDPDYWALHRCLGDVYLHQRRFAEARVAYDRALAIRPNAQNWAVRGALFAQTGKRDSALAILQQMRHRTPRAPLWEAMLEAQLGMLDEAAASFEAGVASPLVSVPSQFHSVLFDPIRSHPRYVAALKKLGVENK